MKISIIKILLAVFITSISITPSSAVEGRPSQPAISSEIPILLYQELRINLQQWTSRCELCKKPFPWKRNMSSLYQADALTILSSTILPEDQSSISRYISTNQVRFYKTDKETNKRANPYDVKAFPDDYLIDTNSVSVQKLRVPTISNDEKAEKNIRKTVGSVIDASG